ncbi:type II toxin-antitoxin system RelE/ParE family toxin [Candidatus Daviesbacteria bacterium]|nr:type II toxin-antitoxin system RelE/ParE family toxin [Candidatus Daviesbacteria bacterium]
MVNWRIIYYQAPKQNNSPVYDFIESLNAKAKSKIINTIDLLEEYGTSLGSPHVKKLVGTDLWEIRILGQDNIRILYIAIVDKTFLLLHGFIKKKQKTDKREINTALARLIEYHSR